MHLNQDRRQPFQFRFLRILHLYPSIHISFCYSNVIQFQNERLQHFPPILKIRLPPNATKKHLSDFLQTCYFKNWIHFSRGCNDKCICHLLNSFYCNSFWSYDQSNYPWWNSQLKYSNLDYGFCLGVGCSRQIKPPPWVEGPFLFTSNQHFTWKDRNSMRMCRQFQTLNSWRGLYIRD